MEKPKNRKLIKTKWVFKVKLNSNGSVNKFKARLVAKGYTQKCGVDYLDTFAPVAKLSTFRIMLALAALYDLSIDQLDVTTAYLHADVQEDLFMEQPEGFEQGSEVEGRETCCKLRKSIYGLKQSGRNWNRTLNEYLLKIGMTQSQIDPCLKGRNLYTWQSM